MKILSIRASLGLGKRFFIAAVALCVVMLEIAFPRAARADVHVDFGIWHGYSFYYANPAMTVSNVTTVSYHRIESPNGMFWYNRGPTNNLSNFGTTNDLSAVLNESTDGVWKIFLNKESDVEEVYYFSVSISGVTVNLLGDVEILSPAEGSVGVDEEAEFLWTGPDLPVVSLSVSHLVSGNSYFDTLPGDSNQWMPGSLTPGDNRFFVNYISNNFPGIILTTPTNAVGEALENWSAQGELHTYMLSDFKVGTGVPGGNGDLYAHFTFDDPFFLGYEETGSGNDGGLFYGGEGTKFAGFNPDGVSGGAIEFDGYNGLFWDGDMVNAFTESYSVSLWLKTTQTQGNNDDSIYNGAGIFSAGGNPVPMTLVGSRLAFDTGYGWHTLHSTEDINSGDYVHLVVTRDAGTGEKRIYVNGFLDVSDFGDSGSVSPTYEVQLGHTFQSELSIQGLVDDLQIYSGVLSPSQIEFLYNNPGMTAPSAGGLGDALEAVDLTWSTGGDAPWFVQESETHDDEDAAQSGAIGDDEESWIETTVHGPGELRFWWKVSSDFGDYLEFYINGDFESDISGNWGWNEEIYEIGPGEHTLRWRYVKDGCCSDYDDAAYLDEVRFTVPAPPIEFSLTIVREVRAANQGTFANQATFMAFPRIEGFYDPISYHHVQSPGGSFQGFYGPTNSQSSTVLNSYDALIGGITNGTWKLWLNKDSSQEKLYLFTISTDSFTSNSLGVVEITSPVNGATGVSPTAPLEWTGPVNWDDLALRLRILPALTNYGVSAPDPSTVSWANAPERLIGTNLFTVEYEKEINDFNISTPYPEWSVGEIKIRSAAISSFVVENTPVQPVTLLNPVNAGPNLEFSFHSQPGLSHVLLSRTNLTLGDWETNSIINGDGQVQQISIPKTNVQQYFRLITY